MNEEAGYLVAVGWLLSVAAAYYLGYGTGHRVGYARCHRDYAFPEPDAAEPDDG